MTDLDKPTPHAQRTAYGYLTLTTAGPGSREELQARRVIVAIAGLEGCVISGVFVDLRGDQPYGFAALHALIRREGADAVIMPSLRHVAHIAAVAPLGRAGLARHLGVPVLLGPATGIQ